MILYLLILAVWLALSAVFRLKVWGSIGFIAKTLLRGIYDVWCNSLVTIFANSGSGTDLSIDPNLIEVLSACLIIVEIYSALSTNGRAEEGCCKSINSIGVSVTRAAEAAFLLTFREDHKYDPVDRRLLLKPSESDFSTYPLGYF